MKFEELNPTDEFFINDKSGSARFICLIKPTCICMSSKHPNYERGYKYFLKGKQKIVKDLLTYQN